MPACLSPPPGRVGSFFSLFCVSAVSTELSFGVSVSCSGSVATCESKKEKQEVRRLSFENHSFESFWEFFYFYFWVEPGDNMALLYGRRLTMPKSHESCLLPGGGAVADDVMPVPMMYGGASSSFTFCNVPRMVAVSSPKQQHQGLLRKVSCSSSSASSDARFPFPLSLVSTRIPFGLLPWCMYHPM